MSEAIGIVERLNDLRLAAFRAGGFDTPAAKAYYRALSTAFQRDELVDAAETSRLTARIAELEKAQQYSSSVLEAIVLEALGPYREELTRGQMRMLADVIAREFRARTTLEASERGGGE